MQADGFIWFKTRWGNEMGEGIFILQTGYVFMWRIYLDLVYPLLHSHLLYPSSLLVPSHLVYPHLLLHLLGPTAHSYLFQDVKPRLLPLMILEINPMQINKTLGIIKHCVSPETYSVGKQRKSAAVTALFSLQFLLSIHLTGECWWGKQK